MQVQSKSNNKSNIWLSARLWMMVGLILILIGFILAHLSNANLIHWSNGNEKVAHIIFHVIGPIILLAGVVKVMIEKLRN